MENSILIRLDRKWSKTFKILHYHYNLLMVNGENKGKQIYKIILTENFFSWLGSSKNKQINWSPKMVRSLKTKTEH